jgi:hypothetical protein
MILLTNKASSELKQIPVVIMSSEDLPTRINRSASSEIALLWLLSNESRQSITIGFCMILTICRCYERLRFQMLGRRRRGLRAQARQAGRHLTRSREYASVVNLHRLMATGCC